MIIMKEKLPQEIACHIKSQKLELLTEEHVSGDLVYKVGEDYILKISNVEGRMKREYIANEFLKGKLPVSENIAYAVENGMEYYLKSRVKGDSLCSERYLKDPEKLTDLLASALHMFHKTETAGCDFYNSESQGNCMVHGDFCLPNILADDDEISAFIDTEAAGLGDPWVDYAWAIWSLEFNLKTKKYTQMLLAKIGIIFDQEKFDKYVTDVMNGDS